MRTSNALLALLCLAIPTIVFADQSELSFIQAGPSVVAPVGRVDFHLRVTNTGSNTWTPLYTNDACHAMLDYDDNAVCMQAGGWAQGQYYIGFVSFDMAAPDPFWGHPWSVYLPLPRPINPGETVEIASHFLAPPVPGRYTVVAFTGQGYYNFTSRVLHSPKDAYDLGPRFDYIVGGPAHHCVGFQAPLNQGPVKVNKNRVLPLKAQLFDLAGESVTPATVNSTPVVQVVFTAPDGAEARDVSAEALPAGLGTEGNRFVFSDGLWRFNLETRQYTAPGSYDVTMTSGDPIEHLITGCTARFVVGP